MPVVKICIGITILYRLIPARVRRLWSFGKSTSHLAIADLSSGEYTGLAAIKRFMHYAIPSLNIGRQPVNWDN